MFVKNQGKYIQKVKIFFGTSLGEEKDEDVFVELREPKTEWMLEFAKAGEDTDGQVLMFKKILPDLIVSHNLTEDGTKLLSMQEVAEVIYESLETTKRVMQEYFNAAFFTQMKMPDEQ